MPSPKLSPPAPIPHRPRWRQVILVVMILVVGAAGWIAYRFINTLREIPDAYAAWDTGTLLIEYLQRHENHWPSSWDDLLTVMDGEEGSQILLRGARAGDIEYAQSLRKMIAIDLKFDPRQPDQRNPVSRSDGSALKLIWGDRNPNQMVRDYLNGAAGKRQSQVR
ncbi:MAG: hypothetical protein K8T25_15320 [Planctomycetia bacterium]|nr:hypothetical protein [Planctomycetia bacterium]